MTQTKPNTDPIIRIRKENIQRLKPFIPEDNTQSLQSTAKVNKR